MIPLNGTTFWMMAAVPPGGGAAADCGPEVFPSASRTRILVVEDNYFVALNIESALLDAGFEVAGVVDSGEEALAVVADTRPDLVLMDIRLAGELDGIDTAIALRDLNIDCVFASAHHDAGMKARGAPAKPRGWLVKPFTDAQLVETVRLALEAPPAQH